VCSPADTMCLTPHGCPCDEYPTCQECLGQEKCTFCGKTRLCAEKTADFQCHDNDAINDIANCPACHSHETCDTCLLGFECGWCTKEKKCAGIHDTACAIKAHTCPLVPTDPKGGFDGGSFVGGIFLGAVLLAIIGGVVYFFVWRRRKGYQAM